MLGATQTYRKTQSLLKVYNPAWNKNGHILEPETGLESQSQDALYQLPHSSEAISEALIWAGFQKSPIFSPCPLRGLSQNVSSSREGLGMSLYACPMNITLQKLYKKSKGNQQKYLGCWVHYMVVYSTQEIFVVLNKMQWALKTVENSRLENWSECSSQRTPCYLIKHCCPEGDLVLEQILLQQTKLDSHTKATPWFYQALWWAVKSKKD